MANREAGWENLPKDCLSMVVDKLDAPSSLIHFGAVCKHWNSVFKSFVLDSKGKRPWRNCIVPMLLIPYRKNNHRKKKLYSIETKKEVSFIKLRRPYTKRCCGSCYGWIATVDKEFVITLSNPFNNSVPNIDLPKLEFPQKMPKGHQYDIKKVVLSADPCSNPTSFVVGVIYSAYGQVAFHKSGPRNNLRLISDVVFYKNLVYVIGHWNIVASLDINGSDPKLKTLVEEDDHFDPQDYSDKAYLVESSMGNLFSIRRNLGDDFETKSFQVWKMVLDDNGDLLKREEAKSIDGDVIFVGDNGTLAVWPGYFSQGLGQPNSIYFTNDYTGPSASTEKDNGIFHLEDGSFEKHYPFQPSHKGLPPYIWIRPPIHYVLHLATTTNNN